MSVSFSKTELLSFLDANTKLSDEDKNALNSIFSACDVENETGEKKADGKLSGDEVPQFMRRVMSELGKLGNYIRNFMDKKAGKDVNPENNPENGVQVQNRENSEKFKQFKQNMLDNMEEFGIPEEAREYIEQMQEMPETEECECWRNEEQQKEYKDTLEKAKQLLAKYADELGLTEEEKLWIKNTDTESISYGSARADREGHVIKFNLNDIFTPNKALYIKVLMHEITHQTINRPNSQAQEKACERRGIEIARKLYNSGLVDDFTVCGIYHPVKLSEVNDDEKMEAFINDWCNACYSHLPEE